MTVSDFHSNEADRVAAIDPLGVAEDLTGESYKNSKETAAAGFLIMHAQNDRLRMLRQEACDTHHRCSPETMRAVLTELGAELHMHEDFLYEDTTREWEVWIHPTEGWMVDFDTWLWAHKPEEVTINSAQLHLNWEINDLKDREWYKAAGGYSGGVYVRKGDLVDVLVASYDARDGLKSTITKLRQGPGSFLKKWVEGRVYGFGPYSEKKLSASERNASQDERIALLPTWMQENLKAEDYIPVHELKNYGL